jgi:hypothetical protein
MRIAASTYFAFDSTVIGTSRRAFRFSLWTAIHATPLRAALRYQRRIRTRNAVKAKKPVVNLLQVVE